MADAIAIPGIGAVPSAVEEKISVATQWQLMWWRFLKHKLAVVSGLVVIAFYVVVIFADFFAYADPQSSQAARSYISPQPIHLFQQGRLQPYVNGMAGKRDLKTFKLVYTIDPSKSVPVRLFAHGFPYRNLGIIPSDRHLIGVDQGNAEDSI